MKKYALICAYNEEKTIVDIISKTLKFVDKVIFVNDGSTDETLSNVRKNFEKNEKVIIISLPKNFGKGYAMAQGFKRFLEEGGDVVVTLDADGQHDPNEIPLVTLMIERGASDIVIGSRYSKLKGYPKSRVFFNILSTFILLLVSGAFYSDVASGYRAYSRSAIEKILPKLSLTGFGVELETLKFAKEYDFKISTVPVETTYEKGKKPNFTKLAHGYLSFAWKYKRDAFKRIFSMN
ncbi:MAG: glycosyltransferase family 2 protein [Candidatus Micrarchaeia archaeon]